MNSFYTNAFIGIYAVFFIIFLLQFFVYRKKEYLYYALYLGVLFIYYLFFTANNLFGDLEMDQLLRSTIKESLSGVAIILYSLFGMYFLEIKKYAPNLFRLYVFFILLNVSGISFYIVCYFLGVPHQEFYYYANIFFVPFAIYLIFKAVQLKIPYTKYIMAGSLIATLGGIWSIVLSLNDEPNSYFPGQLAIVIDIVLFFYVTERKVMDLAAENIRLKFQTITDLQVERQRISQEFHDEIGGGLSTIHLLSELSKNKQANPKYLDIISKNSKELVIKMNEIVWALNIKNDSLQGLVAYIRQYLVQTLDECQINVHTNIQENIPEISIDGKNRRNVFLMVKEIVNNIIKHSGAKNVNLSIQFNYNLLSIMIIDDGVGFNKEQIKSNSFGLSGLQERLKKVNGKIEIRSENGTRITMDIPIDFISYKSAI